MPARLSGHLQPDGDRRGRARYAVDGSRRNPFTDGFICAKVRRYAERVYSPLRVLLSAAARSARRARRASSASAGTTRSTLIAERFQQIIAADGAEAILPYHYGGSNGVLGEGAADARFFHRLGASELLEDALRGADRHG